MQMVYHVQLYGEIDQYAANDLAYACRTLVEEDELLLHVNSPGGSVMLGMTMCNALLGAKCKTTAIVEGVAASAASWVALCCQRVEMNDYALMMWHETYVGDGASGAYKAMESMNASIAVIVAKRTGMDAEQVRAMMAQETWFTAQEAMDMRLCDAIVETGKRLEVDNSAKDVNMHYARCMNIIYNKPTTTKNMEEIYNALGATDEVSALDRIKNVLKEAQSKDARIAALEADTANKDTQMEDLQNRLKEFEDADKARRESDAVTLIDNAIKAGKLKADQKESWVRFAKNSYEETKALIDGIATSVKNLSDYAGSGESQDLRMSPIQSAMKEIKNRQN